MLCVLIFSAAVLPAARGAEGAARPEELGAADALAEAGFKLMATEFLGRLRFGLKAKEVVEICGKAAAKGPVEDWAGVGLRVQKWEYPAQGLELHLSSMKADEEMTVLMIRARQGCSLVTTRGIQMGSTEEEVLKAYGKLRGEGSKPGEMFVAGSTVGGVIFTFEKGKVVEIFIGAAAE